MAAVIRVEFKHHGIRIRLDDRQIFREVSTQYSYFVFVQCFRSIIDLKIIEYATAK